MRTMNYSCNLHTVYFVSGLPQPLRSGLDRPSVCAPDNATISYRSQNRCDKQIQNYVVLNNWKLKHSNLRVPCHSGPFCRILPSNVQQVKVGQQLKGWQIGNVSNTGNKICHRNIASSCSKQVHTIVNILISKHQHKLYHTGKIYQRPLNRKTKHLKMLQYLGRQLVTTF